MNNTHKIVALAFGFSDYSVYKLKMSHDMGTATLSDGTLLECHVYGPECGYGNLGGFGISVSFYRKYDTYNVHLTYKLVNGEWIMGKPFIQTPTIYNPITRNFDVTKAPSVIVPFIVPV